MNSSQTAQPMRVAVAYDLCSPFTVGGAESHYRGLTKALTRRGHDVTYLTSRYWDGDQLRMDSAVQLLAVTSSPGPPTGDRSVRAALRYAYGLLNHLLHHGSEYDVVEVAALPPTSAIAAWLGLLPHRDVRLLTDWHEVWRLATWRERFGPAGALGWLAELFARRLGTPISFSELHSKRLPRRATVVPEFLSVSPSPKLLPKHGPEHEQTAEDGLILCVGRLVDDKRFVTVPATLAELAERHPNREWRAVVVGSGPQLALIKTEAARANVTGQISFESDVSSERLSQLFSSASVLLHPSRREGFGIVVLEASGHGLPVVAVRSTDNAATELITQNVNGIVVDSADPAALAEAVAALAGDQSAKSKARHWWESNSERFTADKAAQAVERVWLAHE